MPRQPNWPEILAAEIRMCMHRRFAWGEHDCALMAADIVREMTGVDYMADIRHQYRSQLRARVLLQKLGGLEAAITARLGEPKPIVHANRGDVVLFSDLPTVEPTTGICNGEHSLFAGWDGLMHRPTLACKCAWSI